MKRLFIKWVGLVSLGLLFLAPGKMAFAHKVNVFAWVDGNTVYSESKFNGGRVAKDALVEVFDMNGEKLLEGRTDDKGNFSFAIPEKTAMRIVLKAGMGHQGEWTIPVEEIGGDVIADETGESGMGTPEKIIETPVSEADTPKMPNAFNYLSKEDVAGIVERELDKKMKPVVEKLNRLLDPHKKPSVSDIIGGIGYIIGLVGLGAYIKSRKEKI
ncbi:MAG: hypothetical protein KJ737_01010 [Proteobacteria bacterium]|nr:hypothetical protein [Pseudomonadota bacterium]